jgi:hypothetical protein
MAYRPHGRANVDPQSPRAFAVCDRCGGWVNHVDLQEQMQWAGSLKVSQNVLVCDRCIDDPSDFLKTLILPPDPAPVLDARVEQYTLDEDDYRVTELGDRRTTEVDDPRVRTDTDS